MQTVKLPATDNDLWFQRQTWAEDNCVSYDRSLRELSMWENAGKPQPQWWETYTFSDEQDAVRFMLKWGS